MHELALSRSIVAVGVRHARGSRVTAVTVRVGHMRQVVPDTLRFCFGIAAEGTVLEGATLEIVEVPVALRCRECGRGTVLENFELRCPGCGGSDLDMLSGQELLVESLELDD